MVKPWTKLTPPEKVQIVAPDGTVRCTVDAYFSGKMFTIDDMSVDVQPGDEIRRPLPNGKDETFHVDDPTYFNNPHFGKHYQVKVSRKGSFPHRGGGYMSINVSGQNARINLHSQDQSTNVIGSGNVFGDMRQAVEAGVPDPQKRAEITARIDAAEKARGSTGFLHAYQALISSAAEHITVLGPFLPALSQMLGGGTS